MFAGRFHIVFLGLKIFCKTNKIVRTLSPSFNNLAPIRLHLHIVSELTDSFFYIKTAAYR